MSAESEITEKEVLKVFENCLKSYRGVCITDNVEQILEKQLPKILNNEKTKFIINEINEVLSVEITQDTDLERLHTLVYCGGKAVTQLCEKYDKIFIHSKIPQEFPTEAVKQKELLENSPQRFRRLLFGQSMEFDEAFVPEIDEIEDYWANKIWGKEDTYRADQTKEYEQNEKARMEELFQPHHVTTGNSSEITMKDLNRALKTKKGWCPPGIDGVQNFWYKKFKPIREALLRNINEIITGKEMPEFFTTGLTYMYPKNGDTTDPSNYRPITYLPSIYKIITRCVHQKIFQHYEKYKILTDEQCGGRKDCYGVRKALVIDAVALDQQQVYGRYVDFKKAFDSVPHEWILKLLEIYRVDEHLVEFLKTAMGKWQTRICTQIDSITGIVPIKTGVFHGDCISVILFWTAINPLSVDLKKNNKGLKLDEEGIHKLSHLLYMDDLKLYAPCQSDLEENYQLVKKFSEAIGMSINDKKTQNFSNIDNKQPTQVYLGYLQNPKISNNESIYHKVRKFEEKYKKIEKTLISDRNKELIKKHFLLNSIFNTFGILHWTLFKRELLNTQVTGKFLPEVEEHGKDLEKIYIKLINDMCRMRNEFFRQAEKSELMKNIVESDRVTPLQLSRKDNKEFICTLVARVGKKGRRKRKVTDPNE